MKRLILIYSLILSIISVNAQQLKKDNNIDSANYLRGALTPPRTCYDINYYHLDVKIDIEEQSVSGSNEFVFTATQDFEDLQFDLFENLKVEKVVFHNQELPFTRKYAAVFVKFPSVKKGTKDSFTVYYSGKPRVAKMPPWDGGFIFKKDKSGNPFVSVACQGLGASVWWPNKDHQSDEVDSMLISISVVNNLNCIANGRLRSSKDLGNGYTKYNWFVANPINNYNVAFYIGKYAHWTDTFDGEDGKLSIDYYALKEDSAKARPHWDADVKPMLKAFEYWFGPYPWYKDGYKLVQAPHLGMEHQSAVAYGNQFLKGYLGRDQSRTGTGLKWDFITIHESGHEWFGNNITTKDIADMWVHEGFTTYSEALFTEYTQGKKAGEDYVIGLRRNIANKQPMIGTYNMNSESDGDMYPKGANLIHTIRQLINNDEKFRQILRGLNKLFYHQTVTSAQVEQYIIKQSGLKLEKVFDQYLRHTKIPTLAYHIKDGKLFYKWITDVNDFEMPVKVSISKDKFQLLKATNQWKSTKIDTSINESNLMIDRNFYVNKQIVN